MIRELLAWKIERLHLMFFIEIAKPNVFERWLILAAQAFWNYYGALRMLSDLTAHLRCIMSKKICLFYELSQYGRKRIPKMFPRQSLPIDYYGLKETAKLNDLIKCVRADEQRHAVANAKLAAGSKGGRIAFVDLPPERCESEEAQGVEMRL